MKRVPVENIEKVLDEKDRPNLALHSGDVKVEKLEDRKLYVRMVGACAGCPSAQVDIEEIVSSELTQVFPDLQEVIMVTGVSDSLIDKARELIRQRHQAGL